LEDTYVSNYIHDIIQDKERITSNLLYSLGWVDKDKFLVITCATIRTTLLRGEGREEGVWKERAKEGGS